MLFNSIDFVVFLGIMVPLFYAIPFRFRWLLLLLASYFFYMYWEPVYILLILTSTVADYFIGKKIGRLNNRSIKLRFVVVSLFINLSILFTFKYYNFFISSIAQVFDWIGLTYKPTFTNLILPIGISFYTFQTISYIVDIYNDRIKPENHFGYFALFVSYFPQLVAGPIERSKNLLPQIRDQKKKFEQNHIIAGLSQILLGFF